MVCGHQHQITIWRFNKMIFLFPLLCQLRAFTAAAKSSCFVSIRRSRIRTAMALWVRFSSLASFLATSRFKSQSGFLGAKFTKSYAKFLTCLSLEKRWNTVIWFVRTISSKTGGSPALPSSFVMFWSTSSGSASGTLDFFSSSSSGL